MKRTVLPLSLVLACQPAVAGFEQGNGLYSKCPAEGADASAEYVGLGYVIGAYDALTAQDAKPPPFCRPVAGTAVQMRDVVCQWLTNNPALRHHRAETVIVEALSQAWPCAKP